MGHWKIPLEYATGREVLLRVALALVKRDYRQHKSLFSEEASSRLFALADETRRDGWTALTPWLLALAAAAQSKEPIEGYTALQCAEFRRGALTERRRLLPSYKSGRNVTPRVTNRGGQVVEWAYKCEPGKLPSDLPEVDYASSVAKWSRLV
jgi:hypothetical protein